MIFLRFKLVFKKFFLVAALVGVIPVSACGGSETAIEVGGLSIDRDSLFVWNQERFDIESSTNIDITLMRETATEWIQNQALVDFLNDYGLYVDETDVENARDQLLASGILRDDPRLDQYSEWQAVRNFAAESGPEVREAYETNKELLGHELCTSHILLESREESLRVLELFESGQIFSDLAITFSIDPGSGQNGGYLGCVPIGAFVPPFERAVLGALKASKNIVGPVESSFGFHVIRIDKTSNVEPPLYDELGEGLFRAIIGLSSLTREVEIDRRYGVWDPVVGQLVPVQGPKNP